MKIVIVRTVDHLRRKKFVMLTFLKLFKSFFESVWALLSDLKGPIVGLFPDP